MIADHIRAEIMNGTLKFGQKISENSYSEQFGVSRTPVREAILGLVSLGLLSVRPRSGTYVVSFTRASLTDLFEVRRTLETAGIRLSTPAQIDRLVAKFEALSQDLARPVSTATDFDLFSLADTDFHSYLVEAADNKLLIQIYQPIAASAQAARSRLEKTPAISTIANTHHFEMVDALKALDIDRFEATLKEHLSWVLGMLMHVDELFSEKSG